MLLYRQTIYYFLFCLYCEYTIMFRKRIWKLMVSKTAQSPSTMHICVRMCYVSCPTSTEQKNVHMFQNTLESINQLIDENKWRKQNNIHSFTKGQPNKISYFFVKAMAIFFNHSYLQSYLKMVTAIWVSS